MKVLHLFTSVVFIVLAGLQLNNPQPALWGSTYLAVAACCALAAFGKFPKWLLIAFTSVLGVWMLFSAPDILRWAEVGFPDLLAETETIPPVVKGARDFMGLVIAFGAMLLLTFRRPFR